MSRAPINRLAILLALCGLVLLATNAQTLVNISTQVTGICAVANGCTGVATASASTVFGRSFTDGSGAPHFFAPSPWDFGFLPDVSSARVTLHLPTGAGLSEYGDVGTYSGAGTNVAASSTLPAYEQMPTNTTNNNVASIASNNNYVVGRGLNFFFYGSQNSTSAQRRWFGLSDQSGATMGASDDPAGNYAAVHYCNDGANAGCATDNSHWFLCTKDNSTINCVDSNVNTDTNFHVWWIHEIVGTSFTLYEYTGGAWVSRAVSSSHLPTSTTPLHYVQTVTCMTCTPTAQNFRLARMEILVLNAPY